MASLSDTIDFLETNFKYLKDDEIKRLQGILIKVGENAPGSSTSKGYGEVDVLVEVQALMQLIVDNRSRVNLKTDSTREVKDVIDSSTKMLATLAKLQGELVNQNRLQKIEFAVVEAISELEPHVQTRFYAQLEGSLP